ARAFAENWIDAGPRPGKVGGAFCIHMKDGASRVLANYTPGYDSVSTLAHELGHAYHNLLRAPRTPLQRRTPMTLAETASTFGELFALGLYARFRAEPDSFRAGYDELLSATGMADAATLAQRFGIDLRSIDFWRSSLEPIREDVDRFVELTS